MRARRTERDKRYANLKRILVRNRIAVRAAMVIGAAALLGGALVLGLPRAALGLAAEVKTFAGRAAGLTISSITVSGLENLKPAEIRKALAVPGHEALYDIDLVAARMRLLEVPWVADATIFRIPRHRLHIAIKERIPAILWEREKDAYAVDAQGGLIAPVDPDKFGALFQVAGDDAAAHAPPLIEALASAPIVSQHLRSSDFVGHRRWDLHFDNHLVVELPDQGLPQALAVLSKMITEEDLLDHDVRVLDLRNPGTPHLRLNKEAAKGKSLPGQET